MFDLQIHSQSQVITNFNVYEDGKRNQKESTFNICVIKSKLFSTCGSITHSASICLMTSF